MERNWIQRAREGGRTATGICLSGDLLVLSQSPITALTKTNVSILFKDANTGVRGGVTQSVKCMLCKLADLGVILQNSHKSQTWWHAPVTTVLGSREENISGVAG